VPLDVQLCQDLIDQLDRLTELLAPPPP
jgi:hypothetical protein